VRKRDVQQGTLALMVLKTLNVLGPLHGYGIAGASSRSAATCSPSTGARSTRCC
jgi:hypothetical protein